MNYRQLTQRERYQIEFLLALGKSKADIAKELNRHRSTIFREIKRNSLEVFDGGPEYDPGPAHLIAKERRVEVCERRYKVKGPIKDYFVEKLARDWSPEQIAGRYNLENGRQVISRSSIYRFVEKNKSEMFSEGFFKKLRFYTPKRRKKVRRQDPRPGGTKRSVRERPIQCDERAECGHFERDLMEGKRGRKAVLVVVDRKSRKVFLRFVKRKSDVVQKSTMEALQSEKIR